VTKPTAEDIDQTVDFIKAHSVAAAATWLDAIQQAIESLNAMPSAAL
jgi:plasmid stabilization system protein ParE